MDRTRATGAMAVPVHHDPYEIRGDGNGSAAFGGVVAIALGAVVFNMLLSWDDTPLVVLLFFWAFCLLCVVGGLVVLAVVLRSMLVPDFRLDADGFHATGARFHAPWSEIGLIEVGTVEVYRQDYQQPRNSGYQQRRVFWVTRGELRYEFQIIRDRPLSLGELERALVRFAGEVPVRVLESVERRTQWTGKP
ncbi:hypothetical protein [Kitasatospora sp. NPDC056184]|uniref:hypothetical protein n=1 Tax=Kitasatospora sp. NPDC056184 TaxID=3345738 RepID=UPI0035E1DA10